jgi:hypothetical protein
MNALFVALVWIIVIATMAAILWNIWQILQNVAQVL